ncbi:DUF3102 domain-containing protein [Gilvimarinus agarilyticus]|uniref:DUF3102 domain-containing protein n=1 Tax=Gilvimarinus agarilyticus TaxID=679259 RepID=UPI0006968095|nr:DUF3102 domain-containing protein [Gilvimarinus agarilyticus]
MARKANTATVIEHTETNEDWVGELAETANQAGEHSQEIMNAYGEGLPYERSRIVREAQFYMAQSAEAMLETGRRLVILKEHEPHGEFLSILDEKLGIAPRTAQQIMQAAIKYASPALQSKAQTFAHLGKSKLFELMVEDDENLSELADGGTVAGMTLEDVDRMSCRELKAKLREAREALTSKDDVASAKQKTIDELMEKTSRIKRMPRDEVAADLRKTASIDADECEALIRGQLRHAFTEVFHHGAKDDDNPFLDNDQIPYLTQRLDLLDDALLTLRAELGIERTVDSPLEFDPSK